MTQIKIGEPIAAVYYERMIPRAIYDFAAYCTSLACAHRAGKVKKNVTRKSDVCPDCRSFLVWKRTKIDQI